MLSQKSSQRLLPWLRKDGEIASIQNPCPGLPGTDHKLPEPLMQFRSSSGEVEAADAPGLQNIGDQFQQLLTHHLRSMRAGIDMAMTTALVAAVAQVDLQRCQNRPSQRGKLHRSNCHRMVPAHKVRE